VALGDGSTAAAMAAGVHGSIADCSILLHYGFALEAANDTVERYFLVGREGVYLAIGSS
jgi:hypothetical protein